MRSHLELSAAIHAHSDLLEHGADEHNSINAANRVQNALVAAIQTLRLASAELHYQIRSGTAAVQRSVASAPGVSLRVS